MTAQHLAEVTSSPQACPKAPEAAPPESSLRLCSFDLEAWRGDLQRLHGTIDQVVQSFISGQTRQLDAVAAELSSQRDRILVKERSFTELSDSIAGFVEAEAQRLHGLGFDLCSAEEDARHEAYDAELPGPPALHRMNRLWRKATKAFESTQQAKECETAAALEEQRARLEAQAAEVELRSKELLGERDAEIEGLRRHLEEHTAEGQQKESAKAALSENLQALEGQLSSSKAEVLELVEKRDKLEASRKRQDYEQSVEREELVRLRDEATAQLEELQRDIASARSREADLEKRCSERAQKLEEMQKIMDEQELQMTQKIERVQQYVKERQATALQAEVKLKDAEKLAERWQGEVRKCQAEKDRLARVVLELESRQSGQAQQWQGASEQHNREVAALQEALRRKEAEMREANLELLSRRDEEYQAKVALEKQREKERSIGLLKKKEQEVQIKDQQLRAAKQRIQDLESLSCAGTSAGSASVSQPASSPTSRGSSSAGKRPSSGGRGADPGLPPLPFSAR